MFARLRSDEPFELDGFWYSPTVDAQLPSGGDGAASHGTLRYSPQRGFELTVFDLLPGVETFQQPDRIPVLFGETLEHEPCVLLGAVLATSEGNLFGGHHRLILRAHEFLVGEHVPNHHLKSKRFHVRLRGLGEWLRTPFRIDAERVRRGLSRDEDPDVLSLQLQAPSVEAPERVSVQQQGPRLLLGFDRLERGGKVMEEHATATFEFDTEVGLQAFFADWLVPLQDFLVLATREQSVLQSLLLERYDERRCEAVHPFVRHGASDETWNRWNVQVVRTPNVPLARPRESAFTKVLLPAAAGGDDLGGLLQRWYELRWRLREAGAHFFTALNQDLPPLTRHLLDCMSFAETYHRVNSDHWVNPSPPPLPKKEHCALRDRMLEELGDHPQRERYRKALDYANRPDNTERITELFARAREIDFAVDLQEEALPGELVATRNYLTHWSKKKTKVLDGVARFQAVRRLRLVLRVNLLRDLGLTDQVVKSSVDESYRMAVWEDAA